MPSVTEKAQHKVEKVREAVSDKVRPDEPGIIEKTSRVARDTVHSVKEGVENAAKAVADTLAPSHSDKKDAEKKGKDAAKEIEKKRQDAADAIKSKL